MRWSDVYCKIFSGLWLLPFALLVYRSRFLPRFLGVWLALAGFAWVILSLTGILSPQYYDKVFTFTQPAVFGELAFMFWLLIKGQATGAGRHSPIVGGWLGLHIRKTLSRTRCFGERPFFGGTTRLGATGTRQMATDIISNR
jgi:hypothetical protein